MDALLTLFWGLVVLMLLIIIHEAGHFIAARAFGVRVTEFMIGLPGPNIGFERKGCRYGITCIPLGGYNRITGMEGGPEDPNLAKVLAYVYRQGSADVEHVAYGCELDEANAAEALAILEGWGSIKKPNRKDEDQGYRAPADGQYALGQAREVSDQEALLDSERAQTYRGLSCWKRLVVLFAGPVLNLVLAFVILMTLFSVIGVTAATTTISGVSQGSPAAEAGLREGDTITAIDGKSIDDWSGLAEVIEGLKVGQKITVSFERDATLHETSLTVKASSQGTPQIGIYAGTTKERLSPVQAVSASWGYFCSTVQAYVNLFNPSTAAQTLSQSSSVVGIAVVAKEAADTGAENLFYIIALISLSLGVVNLVPIPPLDGGKILVEIIQKITRRDISARIINTITAVVVALFIVLFLYLLHQDIGNFILKGK